MRYFLLIIVLISFNLFSQDNKSLYKSENVKCSGTICTLYCPYGFKINQTGCSYCSCRNYNEYWNLGQAETIKKGRFELGIFQALKYGLKDDLELSTYPLLDFIMPNITIKKNWINNHPNNSSSNKGLKWSFSTEHYISYPTLIMQLISKKGIGGLLPETYNDKIPQQIYSEHSAIFTFYLSRFFVVTPKVSLSLPILFNNGANKKFPTIDMVLLYTRTASFHGDFVYTLSLDFDGLIWDKFYYSVDFDYYNNLPINPYDSEGIKANYEHKFLITWKYSDTFSIYAGYKLIYGNYPWGKLWNIFPLIDFVWAW